MENEERKIEVDDFKVSQDIPKKKSKFAIKYIIFIVILVAFTALAIYFTIQSINKEISENNIVSEEIKKQSDDSKYLISSYSETYNNNSINIIKYYDTDGNVSRDDNFYDDYNYRVDYIQIEGLKNKKIQNDINQKLRQKAYALKHQNTYSSVCGNFSNILSVSIFNDENKYDSLNVNLATGEEIKFEELFEASTPINSYLVDALYETTAWQSINLWEDENNDMSKVDMSDFEDKAIMLINNYNKNKNNLAYNIGPNFICIYGLVDKRILDTEYADETIINIDLVDCINEVTMYKKFLTNESIFENDKIGYRGTVVFTPDDEEYETRLNYGKIKDNIFLEEVIQDYNKSYNTAPELEIARKFIKKMSDDTKTELINKTKSNRGVFFQREYSAWYDDEKKYTVVNCSTNQATCSIAYFENEAFLDYIKLKAMPRGDAVLMGFETYYQDKFPNLSISEAKYETYYLNEKGEIIARSYEEMEEILRKEQMQNEVQNEITNIIITNTVDANNTTNNTNTTNTTTQNETQNNQTTNTNVVPKANTIN